MERCDTLGGVERIVRNGEHFPREGFFEDEDKCRKVAKEYAKLVTVPKDAEECQRCDDGVRTFPCHIRIPGGSRFECYLVCGACMGTGRKIGLKEMGF